MVWCGGEKGFIYTAIIVTRRRRLIRIREQKRIPTGMVKFFPRGGTKM